MSDEQRVPFGQTTGGIILIQGVVTAVVSAFVTSAINNSANLPWLSIAALFLGIGIFGFLATSLLRSQLRRVMWGWAPRTLKWLGGLQLTTRRQRDEARKSAEKNGAALMSEKMKPILDSTSDRLSTALVENKQLRESLERALSDEAKSALALQTAHYRIAELEVQSDAFQQEIRDIESRRDARPSLPPPDPRWRLENCGADGNGFVKFRIKNMMPSSVVYNARIDARRANEFEISDSGFWPDLSGASSGEFLGRLKGDGEWSGASIRLTWLDQDLDQQFRDFRIAPIREKDPWEDQTPF